MEVKKYYKDIDLIRLFSCIAVLLYHLNILNGGYLAVCIFFVISGYLSCVSLFKKNKISLKDYYKNRLIKLYLPLLVVVFVSISIISLFPSINWLNLKNETTSVLLSYNNFWQLSANLDYFQRHTSSPFMHFWYISILFQFDLVFPFIYMFIRKIESKTNKYFVCALSIIVSIASTIYFYIVSLNGNVMFTYYNTFSRIFSLLFGVSLGLVHSYFGNIVPSYITKNSTKNKVITAYLFLLTYLFIFIDGSFKYSAISMISVSLISCRLIEYATMGDETKLNIFRKIVKSLSSISYEIYLIQYPVIFLFQSLNLQGMELVIILITIMLSYLLNYALKSKSKNLIKYILLFIFIVISLYGGYKYVTSTDYTKELKELEVQLAINQKLIEDNQKKYIEELSKEKENLSQKIEELKKDKNKLKDVVTNTHITGIGDSVMLGAINDLYKTFPKGYFDAKTSRTDWQVSPIVNDLKSKNILGDVILINLGANGDCPDNCKVKIMEDCAGRDIFWLNTTNSKDFNNRLKILEEKHSNLHIIDWNKISKGHSEYFFADGIHLTEVGRSAYATAIYDSIYNYYLNIIDASINKVTNEFEEKYKNRISFYGNDLLLNIFDYINVKNASYSINKDYNFEILKEELSEAINRKNLNYKVVLVFDKNFELSNEQYNEIITMLSNYKLYVVLVDNIDIDKTKISTIDFYKEIENHPEYLMKDRVHLTNDGNKRLNELIIENLK